MKRVNIASLLAIMLFAGTAGAAITVHTDLNSWRSSLGGYDTETFNDTVLNPGVSVSTVEGMFSGNMWSDRVIPGSATTTWTFSSQLNAWGADFWDLAGPGGAGTGIQVYLDGVAAPAEIPNTMSSGFWGVTSTTAFSQVLLAAGTDESGWAETYNMDNMSYSTITTVPAPGAMVLCGLGASLANWFRRKRFLA